jgi:hypothetical protein
VSNTQSQPAPIDLERVDATVVLDVASGTAMASATMQFAPGHGLTAFDLRQEIDSEQFPYLDLGGGPGAGMRVFQAATRPLRLEYAIAPPQVDQPMPIRWDGDGAWWDVWMSDLIPGRYLEQWLPAGLCDDRLDLTLAIRVEGTRRPHVLVTNGEASLDGPNRWTIRFPSQFTSLSPLWWLAPADAVAVVERPGPVPITVASPLALGHDVDEVAATIEAHLDLNTRAIGTYPHGDQFTCVLWEHQRAMEYDGGCSAGLDSLEHEVFHSWIGRGVKPASQNDGWIDEAVTVWMTADDERRRAVAPLGLDEPPVMLCPRNRWCRVTPREAYREGARLIAGLAHLAGGADAFVALLASVYRAHVGGFLTSEQLEAHLTSALGDAVPPLFERYVYGLPTN